MIVKFLQSKKSKGAGAVDYVLSKKKHIGFKPKILKGNEKITRAIIKNNPFKQKATFGVLSFEEKNIDEDIKYKIMSDFEKVLLPNMGNENYNILWAEHRDKGRLELNFIIPKIELSSQKSLNPFWDKFDRTRINQWREIQNLKYGFTSPLAIESLHTLTKSKTPIINDMAEKLDATIIRNIAELKNQAEIIKFINKIENVRAVKPKAKNENYINVYFGDNKRAVKFKGGVYENSYTNGDVEQVFTKRRNQIARKKEENRENKIEKLQKKLDISITKKILVLNNLFFSNDTDVANLNEKQYNTDNNSISELLIIAKKNRADKIESEQRAEIIKAEKNRMERRARELRESAKAKNTQLAKEAKKRREFEEEVQKKNDKIRAEARKIRLVDQLKKREIKNAHRRIRKQIQRDATEHQARLRADIAATAERVRADATTATATTRTRFTKVRNGIKKYVSEFGKAINSITNTIKSLTRLKQQKLEQEQEQEQERHYYPTM